VLAFALLLASGCAGSDGASEDGSLTVDRADFTEGTLASSSQGAPTAPGGATSSPAPSSPAPGADASLPESTTAEQQPSSRGPNDVLIRVEGAPGTRFSGLCSVGQEESVLAGRVPKRYAYDGLGGRSLSCRIQKQSAGRGNLRVILLAGGSTRSVQQTTTRGGTISVTYAGN